MERPYECSIEPPGSVSHGVNQSIGKNKPSMDSGVVELIQCVGVSEFGEAGILRCVRERRE